MKPELAKVKACIFDTFGTVVDWRGFVIAGDAQLRLKPTGQALRARLEVVHVVLHRACNGEQCATLICQHREAAPAIEELHAELCFQISERLADDRLRAPQTLAGARETSFVRSSNEGANLIQSNAI
jgi:hypothetical protein